MFGAACFSSLRFCSEDGCVLLQLRTVALQISHAFAAPVGAHIILPECVRENHRLALVTSAYLGCLTGINKNYPMLENGNQSIKNMLLLQELLFCFLSSANLIKYINAKCT